MQTPTEDNTGSSRRDFLRGVGGAMAATAVAPHLSNGPEKTAALPIAVSDRGVGLRQGLGVFGFARQAGVAGVELDLGRLGTAPAMANRLLDAGMRRRFQDAAEAAGIAISALALTAFRDQPFSGHPKAEEYAGDLMYLMRQMRVPVGLLPLDADTDYSCGQTVERLQRLAPVAEREGLTIALESRRLPADKMMAILDAVGSTAFKAAIVAGPGFDAAADLAVFGVGRVAQVRYRHDNDNDPSAALADLAATLRSAGWDGWYVVDQPAVTLCDPHGDTALAVDRMRGALRPALA